MARQCAKKSFSDCWLELKDIKSHKHGSVFPQFSVVRMYITSRFMNEIKGKLKTHMAWTTNDDAIPKRISCIDDFSLET